MTIWDKLEAKQRRRLVVPIQVTDPSEDEQTWMGVLAALDVQRGKDTNEINAALIDQLEKQLAEAKERVEAHSVNIELQSLPAKEWEAAQLGWRDDEGNIDWAQALPDLLEASCVDEELRDAERWRQLMAKDSWTEGDTNALRIAIVHLNIDAQDPQVPKG